MDPFGTQLPPRRTDNEPGMVAVRAHPVVSSAVAAPERAEVKVNVRSREVNRAIEALGLTPESGAERSISFYDTPGLDLAARGVVLRARKKSNGEQSTLKIRPADPALVPPALAEADGYKLELEVGAGKKRRTISASIDAKLGDGSIAEVSSGEEKPKKLFTKKQRALAEALSGDVPWKKLRAFGPFSATTWKVADSALGAHDADAELWRLPGNRKLLELSIKCPVGEVEAVRASLIGLLAGHGLAASSSSTPKTERALLALSTNG